VKLLKFAGGWPFCVEVRFNIVTAIRHQIYWRYGPTPHRRACDDAGRAAASSACSAGASGAAAVEAQAVSAPLAARHLRVLGLMRGTAARLAGASLAGSLGQPSAAPWRVILCHLGSLSAEYLVRYHGLCEPAMGYLCNNGGQSWPPSGEARPQLPGCSQFMTAAGATMASTR
jgi:hypothetical protein